MAPRVPGDALIHNKILIAAVRKRPILYDKTVQGYSCQEQRKAKWIEIGATLFPHHWGNWNRSEKREAVQAIQKRWGNLRTTFTRELKKKKNTSEISRDEDGSPRKYLYHDGMSFLIKFLNPSVPFDEEMLTTSPGATQSDDDQDDFQTEKTYLEENDDDDDNLNGEAESNGESETAASPPKKRRYLEVKTEDPLYESVEIKRNWNEDVSSVDQEVNFAMSLVPMLKALPLPKKIQAQIETLKVFQRIV